MNCIAKIIKFFILFFSVIMIFLLSNCDNLNPLEPFGKVNLTVYDGAYGMDKTPAIVFESEFYCPVFSPWGITYWGDITVSGYGESKYDAFRRHIGGGWKITTNQGIVYSQYSIQYGYYDRAKYISEFRQYVPGQKHQIEINNINWGYGSKGELLSYTAM